MSRHVIELHLSDFRIMIDRKILKSNNREILHFSDKQVTDSEPMTMSLLTGHVNKDTHPTLSLMITDD